MISISHSPYPLESHKMSKYNWICPSYDPWIHVPYSIFISLTSIFGKYKWSSSGWLSRSIDVSDHFESFFRSEIENCTLWTFRHELTETKWVITYDSAVCVISPECCIEFIRRVRRVRIWYLDIYHIIIYYIIFCIHFSVSGSTKMS